MHPDQSLSIIDEWRRKSVELANPSKIDIHSPMKKALDAMSLILSSNTDHNDIRNALLSLDSDRKFAMQFEKPKDAVRVVGYGILECIHLTLLRLTEKIENLEGIIQSTTTEDNAEPAEIPTITAPPLAPKEEPATADPSPISMENETSGHADAPCPSFSAILKDDPDLLNFIEDFKHETAEDHHLPSNSGNLDIGNMDGAVKIEIHVNPNHNSMADDSIDEEREEDVDTFRDDSQALLRSIRECINNQDASKTPVMKSKRKSSGTDLKTPKRKRSQEDSDADHEYTPKAAKKNVPKKSGTEMKCHKCEFRTNYVREFASHLQHKHSTSAIEEGVALRCECGHESYVAKHHSIVCPRANFTVIRKPRDTSTPTTPKCILCDMYPKSAYGYAFHLHHIHQTKLKEKGYQLKCACGDLRDNITAINKHAKMCTGKEFTLHKTSKR